MPDFQGVSIGEVEKITGISVFTLRMWERRYGQPASIRLTSGHRRYAIDEVNRLTRVNQLIQSGVKTREAVGLTYAELEDRLAALSGLDPRTIDGNQFAAKIMEAILAWDEGKICKHLKAELFQIGTWDFLDFRIAQILGKVGLGWEQKMLTVAHEHFFSNILDTLLQEKWRSANPDYAPQHFVLATLEGEDHALGLQMCATALTALGHRVTLLGAAIPEADIEAAYKVLNPTGVCLSFSCNLDKSRAAAALTRMRQLLPQSIRIVTGGSGSPRNVDGCTYIEKFSELRGWLVTQGMNSKGT